MEMDNTIRILPANKRSRFLVIEESYLGIFRKFSDPYGKTFRSGRKKISLVTKKKHTSDDDDS